MKKITDYTAYWKILFRRFWNSVDVRKPDECWEWKKSRTERGYGKLEYVKDGKAKTIGAHKMAYMLTYGSVPEDLLICHTCDNPPCCNPFHIFAGTNQDNRDDCVKKKRHAVGIKNGGGVKLDETQVIKIRELYKTGNYTQDELVEMFQVSMSTIQRVLYRRGWKHI